MGWSGSTVRVKAIVAEIRMLLAGDLPRWRKRQHSLPVADSSGDSSN